MSQGYFDLLQRSNITRQCLKRTSSKQMKTRWWAPASLMNSRGDVRRRQVLRRWSTLTQRQHCGDGGLHGHQQQQQQPQQQHLRSSPDNVSFSLNDVGVTRARSHLHVFWLGARRARGERTVGRAGVAQWRRPESDTLPLARQGCPWPRFARRD